jgi:hypothetical protein
MYMKYILFMLIGATRATLPPLCINCKFFKADAWVNKFGKCTKFPNEDSIDYFLVSGTPDTKNKNYYYCSTTRAIPSMCGPQGKLFEQK